MLSFLQQRLGRSPSKSQTNRTRQDSIESAFARVNARNVSQDVSLAPSLTTATSSTDTSSEPADGFEKVEPESHLRTEDDVKTQSRSRNTSVFFGSFPHAVPMQNMEGESRTVIDEADNRDGQTDLQEQLLQSGVQALDGDWAIGALPGDSLGVVRNDTSHLQRRKSPRIKLFDRASIAVERTTSILGKRGREVMEAGMEKMQALQGANKRQDATLRGTENATVDNPKKRARFSIPNEDEGMSLQPSPRIDTIKKRSKHWVNQGLYVGQQPDFNPKFTERQNKQNKSLLDHRLRKASAMPLPMFAGARVLAMGRDFKLPFDVFSPLPPGQPKPDEWKKTHKNVFIGDAAESWKKAKPQEHSLCICIEEDGCGDRCLNRFMLYECDDSNCNIGPEYCTNRAFAELKRRCKKGGKYNIGVEVMKTIDRGYGVRANRTFEPNQIIVEYTGEIITQDECDHRMNSRYKDAECYYLMDFDQSMVLDATRGSIARFINHSCAPNCRMIKWTVSGKPRMALFAGDDGIMTGEELTYDYNFDPFSAKNVQECRCGAEGCRGVLGPKPKEIKEVLKPMITNKKRKIQQVVEDVVETVTKKRKIAVPSSMKSMFASAKAQTSKLPQADMQSSSNDSNRYGNKKAPQRSGKRLKGRSMSKNPMEDKKEVKSKSTESRRRSTGDILPRGWKGWALVETPPDSPINIEPGEEGGSKWESIETKASGIKNNIVKTVRRSNRGIPGSTRVVALGEDEFKEWR